MIMRKLEKGESNGTAKTWSYPDMEKLPQTALMIAVREASWAFCR
jgi:hypothetical protein